MSHRAVVEAALGGCPEVVRLPLQQRLLSKTLDSRQAATTHVLRTRPPRHLPLCHPHAPTCSRAAASSLTTAASLLPDAWARAVATAASDVAASSASERRLTSASAARSLASSWQLSACAGGGVRLFGEAHALWLRLHTTPGFHWYGM